MQKLLFVMNPCAGMRKANKLLTDILSVFCQAGYLVTVHMTLGQGDARDVVARLAEKTDIVVCCGGDGTFNETLSGILQSGVDIPVGYIPAGSTNDFANSLHLSMDPVQAAKDIVQGTAERFDLGQFNDRYFSYVASFGAFTAASYSTPQSVKNALGHVAYVLGGIHELSNIHPVHVHLDVDGQSIDGDYIFGAICNCTSVGGILTLNPSLVDMRDGKFELLLVRSPKDMVELGECILSVQRQQYNSSMMTFLSGSHIRVETDPDMPWTLDGERADGSPVIEIDNLQHKYRLMTKAESV